jgi:DNA invertase Pin-like site-specific DNA recombinase
MVTRLDRLARSSRDLLNVLHEVAQSGVAFTTTPHGQADAHHPRAGLAEFERSLSNAVAILRCISAAARRTITIKKEWLDVGTHSDFSIGDRRQPDRKRGQRVVFFCSAGNADLSPIALPSLPEPQGKAKTFN